jgi:chromate reductase
VLEAIDRFGILPPMITIIAGTNRPGSNTRRIANVVDAIYAGIKAPRSIIDLATLPAEIYSPESYAVKPAAFSSISQQVLNSDGLVIITPEYNGSFPGILKYFIDMLKFPESFDRRPVCFIGLSAGIWGGLRSVEQLEMIFGYRNAHIFPERVFIPRIGDAIDPQGTLFDPELRVRLEKQAAGFVDFVEKLKSIHLAHP